VSDASSNVTKPLRRDVGIAIPTQGDVLKTQAFDVEGLGLLKA
jgi:hypothetical protein